MLESAFVALLAVTFQPSVAVVVLLASRGLWPSRHWWSAISTFATFVLPLIPLYWHLSPCLQFPLLKWKWQKVFDGSLVEGDLDLRTPLPLPLPCRVIQYPNHTKLRGYHHGYTQLHPQDGVCQDWSPKNQCIWFYTYMHTMWMYETEYGNNLVKQRESYHQCKHMGQIEKDC